MDIKSCVNVVIPAGERVVVSTDLQIEFPKGCYGRLAGRSGLAKNYFITVLGGVIDRDYTGPLKIILANLGSSEFRVERGDRIAQLICEQYVSPVLEQVDSIENNSSWRGDCGVGSTGMK